MADRPKGSIAAHWADSYKLPRDRFLGSADVATKLGVTRQRVSQLRRDPTFPSPRMQGWGAFVWDAAGIECWAGAHRPNNPEAAGRFVGEASAVLTAAEQHAARMGTHWVDTAHFWLAIAAGAGGPSLAGALDSMGLTAKEIDAYIAGWQTGDIRPRRSYRMTPHLQGFLASADRAVASGRRDRVRPLDILLAFIDAKWERNGEDRKPRPPDNFLSLFDRCGLDIDELRRRLVKADADPASVAGFKPRALRRLRRTKARMPKLELAPNPLGHDPFTRSPWGAGFAVTRDGQHLKVNGEVWFFNIDGDGFYMRAPDGRPVGYRYRVEPPPRLRKGQTFIKPVNGFMEILPMPPVEMADWPDRRFVSDD
jgi:predicted DNA-binding transcriptional regulator AlpA